MVTGGQTAVTAGTYERVSRVKDDREDRERSVDQQQAENAKACQRYGLTITARYADPGRSASRFARCARENWQHVLEAVKARRFDVLVLWETSRASCDPEEWIPCCPPRSVRMRASRWLRLSGNAEGPVPGSGRGLGGHVVGVMFTMAS
ncbi:MAG: recombinase family protein [Pseudonocardiaceae bacterium]